MCGLAAHVAAALRTGTRAMASNVFVKTHTANGDAFKDALAPYPVHRLFEEGLAPSQAHASILATVGTLRNGGVYIKTFAIATCMNGHTPDRGLFAGRSYVKNEVVTWFGGKLVQLTQCNSAQSCDQYASTNSQVLPEGCSHLLYVHLWHRSTIEEGYAEKEERKNYILRISDSHFYVDGMHFAKGISRVPGDTLASVGNCTLCGGHAGRVHGNWQRTHAAVAMVFVECGASCS